MTQPNTIEIVAQLIPMLDGQVPDKDPVTARQQLTAWLTATSAARIPEAAWPLLHELWKREAPRLRLTDSATLPRITNSGRWTDQLSLWRGDITRLKAGAIVNAANSGLTGCYVPLHACVDNAIHTAAGPWLRVACEQIMHSRGRPEPTGTATATKAFYLPSGYVLHTVGPIVSGGVPADRDRDELETCYRECLGETERLGVESVAFCAISTGIFGYPKQEAARLSLRAIGKFLISSRNVSLHVILVAFSENDETIYRDAFREILS